MVTYDDLPKIRRRHSEQLIVLATGSFDLFHGGHVLFFEDCKKYGDVLVVGVGNDVSTNRSKEATGRPILNEHLRLKVVDAIGIVDYAFVHKPPPKGSKHHNIFVEEIFKKLKPNRWIITEGSSEVPFRKRLSAKYGVEFIVLPRECPPEFGSISTTRIIEKIRNAKFG